MATTTRKTKPVIAAQPKTRPTVAEMKARLAQIASAAEVYEGKAEHAVAEAIGTGVAKTVTAIGAVGTNTATFFDAMATSYKFNRAVATGQIEA